ncbi:MAG TPA: DUF4349 domain-containing protein [Bacillota bacterium]
MNKKALTKGLFIFGAGFIVMFVIGLIGGYVEPVPQAPLQQSLGAVSRFEYNVKNVASTQMKVQGNGSVKVYEVDQKYQKVADLATETGRFSEDEQKIRAVVKKHNALIQYEENTGLPGSRFLQLAIGVPPARFDAMVLEVKKIGALKSFNISKTDKTNEFKELQGKRRSLEQTRASLLALKARSGGKIDEYINLENRILEIEQELQNLGVQLGDYDVTNEFCTIKMTLSETAIRISPSIWFRIIKALEWAIKYYLLLVVILCVCSLTTLILVVVFDKIKRLMRIESNKASEL